MPRPRYPQRFEVLVFLGLRNVHGRWEPCAGPPPHDEFEGRVYTTRGLPAYVRRERIRDDGAKRPAFSLSKKLRAI